MCGVAGLWHPEGGDPDRLQALARAMADTLRHRGPDAGGSWCDPEAGVALGHRRLAIIDLSPAGAQPMTSADGRFVLSYNGEIYNARELARELEERGVAFRGHSDTEVMVEGFAAWGVEATVRRLIGMFAAAVWDRRERRLTLFRDRMGIKPLYWGRQGGVLLFGSELKALHAHPAFDPALEPGALALFLRHGYVPAPWTIHRLAWKVLPGELIHFQSDLAPRSSRYWDTARVAGAGEERPLAPGPGADRELEELLADAVGRRMVADVPLGAFLSGGIDSSLVVALMQRQSHRPVKSFAIGFTEADFNEAHHAKAVARHLGTDHTELYVDPDRARGVIPLLPTLYDEPFADTSQIPTFLVSQLARREVTVALSGDGGDELFGGYDRYGLARGFWGVVGGLPGWARQGGAAAIQGVPVGGWEALGRLLPPRWRPARVGDKAHKLAGYLRMEDPIALYRQVVSPWADPEAVIPGAVEPPYPFTDPAVTARRRAFFDRMRLLDCLTYLPDDILTKVDRASMGVSLEARVPLLDHRVVELAWRWPTADLWRQGRGKQPLRRILHRYVPPELVERPKQGFTVPLGEWLRGALREWAESLLSEAALRASGHLEPAPIRGRWGELLAGTRAWHYPIWHVLMFQAWFHHWKK